MTLTDPEPGFQGRRSFLSSIAQKYTTQSTYLYRTWLRDVPVFAIANPSVCHLSVCL